MVERNNENNLPFENAIILKKLGSFFIANGSKGYEYHLNACVLFLQRAEK
jgi:hypothetical protein